MHTHKWYLQPYILFTVGAVLIIFGVLVQGCAVHSGPHSKSTGSHESAEHSSSGGSDSGRGSHSGDPTSQDQEKCDWCEWIIEAIHHVFQFIAIGLLVGAVMTVGVEFYFRRQELEENLKAQDTTARLAFRAIYKTAIPEDVVDEMYDSLISPAFVRNVLEITYTFSKADAADKVRVTRTVHVIAENLAQQTEKLVLGAKEFVLLDDPTKDVFVDFKVDRKFKKEGESIDDLQPRWVKSRQPVAVMVPPGGTVDVTLTVEKTCWKQDCDAWITKSAATRMMLNVRFDEDLKDLDCFVDQWHRIPLKLQAPKEEDPLVKTWVLSEFLLPHQGFILYWSPKVTVVPVEAKKVTDEKVAT